MLMIGCYFIFIFYLLKLCNFNYSDLLLLISNSVGISHCNHQPCSYNNYDPSSSTLKLFYKTNRYEKYSIAVSAVESWNKIQKQLKNMLLKDLSLNKIKTVVTNFYFKSC